MSDVKKNDLVEDADQIIQKCLSLDSPQSFFLFAGAGSGKTRSLKNALDFIKEKFGDKLLYQGKRVAVVTYTNAACDEIKQRVGFNPLFEISTIHSFAWILIKDFPTDIRQWLQIDLTNSIADLQAELAKGKPGTKAEVARKASLAAKQKRLSNLINVTKFNYNPNGENSGKDSLNHSEVIKLASYFLAAKPLMQQILISQFPILLVDESQDTNKDLIEALLKVDEEQKGKFLIGLFGDTMQRIYLDGKPDLGTDLPDRWKKPSKVTNHRSPVRIVKLINKIRSSVDHLEQIPREDAAEGIVRLFLISKPDSSKDELELVVQEKMKAVTNDELWIGPGSDVKKLILEHHMAAARLGFKHLFESLYGLDKYKTGLLDGSLSSVKLFSRLIFPILKAKEQGNDFLIAELVQKNSSLLDNKNLKSKPDSQLLQLQTSLKAVDSIYDVWKKSEATFSDMLKIIAETNLFEIPSSLLPHVNQDVVKLSPEEIDEKEDDISNEDSDLAQFKAIEAFLSGKFNQIEHYSNYIEQRTSFDTHQGIKGREFDRVMVIIDDSESRGFLYKYNKLFGVEPLTKKDKENEQSGIDSSISRPKRLFYVTCSRAEKSLAIVAYTDDAKAFKDFVTNEKWFEESEIEIIT